MLVHMCGGREGGFGEFLHNAMRMVVQVDRVCSTHRVKGYSSILDSRGGSSAIPYLYFDSTIHPNCWTSTVEKEAQVTLNRFVSLIDIFLR